jgi:hypothetical protein
MRRSLHFSKLLFAVLLISISAIGQSDRFAYAITDLSKEGSGWNALRKINTHTGEYSEILLNGTDPAAKPFHANTRKEYIAPNDSQFGIFQQSAFGTGVAAIAYDRKNNRIYYTPMFIDQLRYVDLRTMQLYYVTDQPFTGLGNMHNDEGKIVTRMAITPDGKGYAVTNDGQTFIKFSTGKKLNPEVLGPLVDDPNNKGISVHNRCTSFGGDMIADDDGNLYIVSARNNVFKVDIETRVAKHIGAIQGLPANFTTNGLVVNENGDLLASSAVYAASYYTIDPTTWMAVEYKAAAGVFRSSDLANSNVLQTTKSRRDIIQTIPTRESQLSKSVQVFPNPVTNNRFTLQFSKLTPGDYSIELTDVTGRQIMQRRVFVVSNDQTENISLSSGTARGVYMIKVNDRESKAVFTQKIVLQ